MNAWLDLAAAHPVMTVIILAVVIVCAALVGDMLRRR